MLINFFEVIRVANRYISFPLHVVDLEIIQEMAEENSGIYIPCKVEPSTEGRKRKKINIIKYESEQVAVWTKVEPGHESSDEASNMNTDNLDRKPPLKKIRLESSSNNISNENESILLTNIKKEIVEEAECNIKYEHADANFFSEELTSDDEIFTFQCPKSFDVTCLLNITLDLSKCTKLNYNFNEYICQTFNYEEKKIIDCIFPSKEKGVVIMKIQPVGHIILRQKPRDINNTYNLFEENDSEIVQLPDFQIYKRHPLLGSNWNDHFEKVRMHLQNHKKILQKSLKYEKSLEMCAIERKEKKEKLKNELALLKKKAKGF